MQSNQVPARFPVPFADGAAGQYIRAIPQASQIGVEAGAASLTDGFPPVTFSPVNAGGTPPFGKDFNGVLNQATAWCRWVAAGGPIRYDAGFSGSVGGYPLGARLGSASIAGRVWYNTVEANTTDPDATGSAGGWLDPLAPLSPTYTNLTTPGTGAYIPKVGCVRIKGRMIGAGGGGGGSAGSGAMASFGGWQALGGAGGQSNQTPRAGGGQGTPGLSGSGAQVLRTPGASGGHSIISLASSPGNLVGPGAQGAGSPFGSGGGGNGNDAVVPGAGGGSSTTSNGSSATGGCAGEYVEFSWPAPFPASIPYSVPPGGSPLSGGRGGPGGIWIEEFYRD